MIHLLLVGRYEIKSHISPSSWNISQNNLLTTHTTPHYPLTIFKWFSWRWCNTIPTSLDNYLTFGASYWGALKTEINLNRTNLISCNAFNWSIPETHLSLFQDFQLQILKWPSIIWELVLRPISSVSSSSWQTPDSQDLKRFCLRMFRVTNWNLLFSVTLLNFSLIG